MPTLHLPPRSSRPRLLVVLTICLLVPCSFAQADTETNQADHPMVRHLSQAIQIPTVSHTDNAKNDTQPFSQFIAFVRTTYPTLFAKLSIEVIAEHNLIIKWQGSNPALKPILIDSHYDVVPIEANTEQDWSYPPFSGKIAQNHIWGRGAIDDKSAVIAYLEALTALQEQGFKPQRTLYFSVVRDEEVGGAKGAAIVSQHLFDQDIDFAYVLGEGGIVLSDSPFLPNKPMAMIAVAEKTFVTLELNANGEGGHSSMPVKNNSIAKLANAVSALHNNPFPTRLTSPVSDMFDELSNHVIGFNSFVFSNQWLTSRLIKNSLSKHRAAKPMIQSTTAVTLFNSGIKENVIPQRATALVNFRLLPDETLDHLMKQVIDIIDNKDIEVSVRSHWPSPPIADMQHANFKQLQQIIESSFPTAGVVPGLMTATSDSAHYMKLAKNIYRFRSYNFKLKEAGSVHGTNERLSITSAIKMAEFSQDLIRALGSNSNT